MGSSDSLSNLVTPPAATDTFNMVFNEKVAENTDHRKVMIPKSSFRTLSKRNEITGEWDIPATATGQKSLVVEKGTIVFVDPPAVRE